MAPIDGPDPSTGTLPTGVLAVNGSQAQTPEQLRTLAAQFESLLLNQMMNAMRSSMFDDDADDAGFAKGPLADALYSDLSMALSRAGGFGFTDTMIGPLMKQAGTNGMNLTNGTSDGLGTTLSPALTSATVAAQSALSSLGSAVSPGSVRMPAFLSARVSSQYGWRHDPINGGMKFHAGTDIAVPEGQDVPSAISGRVTFAGERSGYGRTVEVEHAGGMTTRYAHLSAVVVEVGDAVAEGQTLGKSGATGRVTGPHLHFEVLDQGQPLDLLSGLRRLAAVQAAD